MEYVDCCREEDIHAVADLHNKVFFESNEKASDGLQDYYREVFLHNPWVEDDIFPLVYRAKGKVIGFYGRVPRRMILDNRPIRAAVGHRLMVDPDCGSNLAAIKLVRTFFSGPQDLTIVDGANDLGRKISEGGGGHVSYLYSMNWVKPLRLFNYALDILSKKTTSFLQIGKPFCGLMDCAASCVLHAHLSYKKPSDCKVVEIDHTSLLSCIEEFSRDYRLRPKYDNETIMWLWEFLEKNEHRGLLKGDVVCDRNDKKIGAYLYYLKPRGIAEVMMITGRRKTYNRVFECLLHRVWSEGATCVIGRMEPKFLHCFWDHNCLVKKGSWAIIHAKDNELLNIINRGDAFLSSLEAELLFRGPNDRL